MKEIEFDLNAINEAIKLHLDGLPSCVSRRARDFHIVESTYRLQSYNVRLGRAVKYFAKPDETVQEVLHKAAISQWKGFDQSLEKFDRAHFTRLAFSDIRLIRMKYLLHKWLKDFTWHVKDGWFGPGETFLSAHGDTSQLAKLMASNWTCTRKAFPFFVEFVESNRPIRRWVLENFGCPGDPTSVTRALQMATEPVIGSRLETVAKDNDKRRTINVESTGNTIVQNAIGLALFRKLKELGNDLWCGQQLHEVRVKDEWDEISTIDLSNASDSVTVELCRFVLPPAFFELLMATRSPCTLVDGVWIRPTKISSMGNGWTFPVMTLLLLAACHACGDVRATVYGDDIIVSKQVSRELSDFLGHLGFSVNMEKSFFESPFKESCGAFTFNGENIDSFKLEWAETPVAAIALVNKIYWYSTLDGYDKAFWKSVYDDLILLIPDRMKGPLPRVYARRDNLDFWVWTKDFSATRSGSAHWLEQKLHYHSGSVACVDSFCYKDAIITGRPNPRFDRLIGENLRLRNSRLPLRTVRNKGTWERCRIFVTRDGLLCTNKTYRYWRNYEGKFLSQTLGDDSTYKERIAAWAPNVQYERFINARGPALYLHGV